MKVTITNPESNEPIKAAQIPEGRLAKSVAQSGFNILHIRSGTFLAISPIGVMHIFGSGDLMNDPYILLPKGSAITITT